VTAIVLRTLTPRPLPTFHTTSPGVVPPPFATMDERTMFVRLSSADTILRTTVEGDLDNVWSDGCTRDTITATFVRDESMRGTTHRRTEEFKWLTTGLWSVTVL